MRTAMLTCFLLLLCCSLVACAANTHEQPLTSTGTLSGTRVNNMAVANTAKRIVLTTSQQQIIVRLYDNSASRDLLAMLPLTLTFKEYAATEKIAYLPKKLDTSAVDKGSDIVGDFNYFAPWGNLAIFYKGQEHGGNGLVVLGSIESGKAVLNSLNTDFTVTIEQLD